MTGLLGLVDLARLACFLGFLVLGLRVALRRGEATADPQRVDALLVYVLALTGLVGLLQRESWPFTNWALVHGLAPRTARSWTMEGVDAAGRVYEIDPRILQPLAPEEFGAWILAWENRLDPAARAQIGRFLLERAEAARRRLLAGQAVAPNARLLGPLAAPYHFLVEKRWRSPADVPGTPFVGLRVLALEWDVEERFAGAGRLARRVILEFPGPATAGATAL